MNDTPEIIEIFWQNVDWHRQNKKMSWLDLVGSRYTTAKKHTANINLKTVQNIAELLDIDDYAILFERVDEK